MKKVIVSLFTIVLAMSQAYAATWVAADRVETVGKTIISKNNLPAKTTFKVVNGAADNSNTGVTNVVQISSRDLAYTGNDSEVAAVISNEIGHIINGTYSKNKMRNAAKNAITSKLSSENLISTAANSEYLTNKTSLSDEKAADISRKQAGGHAQHHEQGKAPGAARCEQQGEQHGKRQAQKDVFNVGHGAPPAGYGAGS